MLLSVDLLARRRRPGGQTRPYEDPAIKTSELQYNLPAERIAQEPCRPRDAARLMVLHRETGKIQHRVFRDLPALLTRDDCLVINHTGVLPAKFTVHRRTGGRLEGLFLKETSPGLWEVLLGGVGRLKEGEPLTMDSTSWSMVFRRRLEGRSCEVEVRPSDPAGKVLEVIGQAPLPPYIRRSRGDPPERGRRDRQDYQTVYASAPGSVAAPTAGLHFTSDLLREIRQGVGTAVAELSLHVGLGTFQPVEVADLADHPMHREWYNLPADSAAAIQRTQASGGRILAVGTTSVRTLESCTGTGELRPQSGWTDLLIYPPYTFRVTDALLTNFHLPGSTLLALVYAFAGRETALAAYRCAIDEGYRFYSFGDAMLIL